MTPRDISDPIASYVNDFAGFFSDCFRLLNSIKFMGTDLLTFTISILILGALFPIIFSLVTFKRDSNSSNERKPSKSKKDDPGD